MPGGFEPLGHAVPDKHKSKFANFIGGAEKVAKKAAEIAECRGLKLLIYFATDHARMARPRVERHLSQFGRVIFGLDIDEVGHTAPEWSPSSREFAEKFRKDCDVKRQQALQNGIQDDPEGCHLLPIGAKDEIEQAMQADMAMVRVLCYLLLFMSNNDS